MTLRIRTTPAAPARISGVGEAHNSYGKRQDLTPDPLGQYKKSFHNMSFFACNSNVQLEGRGDSNRRLLAERPSRSFC